MSVGPKESISSEERQGQEGTTLLRTYLAKYGDGLRRYAQDASLEVEVIKPERKGKDQPESWAIDLEKGTIYADPEWFAGREYTPADIDFAVSHEVEHFRELRELLSEPNGYKVWQRHRARMKAKQSLFVLDDILDNMRVDRAVMDRRPSKRETGRDLRARLQPQDLTKYPKHLQFAQAILREATVPGERCVVTDDVRAGIATLEAMRAKDGRSVIDLLGAPRLPPSKRLALQERLFEPLYEKFFQEDVQEQRKQGGQGAGRGGTPAPGQNSVRGTAEGTEGTDGNSAKAKKKKRSWWPFGPKANSSGAASGQGKGKDDGKKGEKGPAPVAKPGGGAPVPSDDDLFKEAYDEILAQSPQPFSQKDLEKAVEAYARKHGLDKTPVEREEEEYAEEHGITPENGLTVEDLRVYRRLFEQVVALRNPATQESVLEELRAIFRRIIAERTKIVWRPHTPTTDGVILINPAQAYADVLAGKEETESGMTLRAKERPGESIGAFDIILVADGSQSMNEGAKKNAQRLCAVLLTESLQEFVEELEERQGTLDPSLQVRTALRAFGMGEGGHAVLKELSPELMEKERCHFAKALGDNFSGNTPDFLPLEAILRETPEEEWEAVRAGKLRKIIIVLTDGESYAPNLTDNAVVRTMQACAALREKGAKVVALGMTAAAKAVETTYAPDGQVVLRPEGTAVVLGKLLKEVLSEA